MEVIMKLKYRLLDHPFYQSWTEGTITMEQLSKYAQSYMELIEDMPNMWDRSVSGMNANDATSQQVIQDETEHIELWKTWSDKLEKSEDFPRMSKLIDSLQNMNPSQLLGAIHSFEVQQPAVAVTKKQGLIDHYGFDSKDLLYFDDHMEEQEHIAYGQKLYNTVADKEDFENGFELGSELFYEALDNFTHC
jgi:pyrroloquinoline-quinone synthase